MSDPNLPDSNTPPQQPVPPNVPDAQQPSAQQPPIEQPQAPSYAPPQAPGYAPPQPPAQQPTPQAAPGYGAPQQPAYGAPQPMAQPMAQPMQQPGAQPAPQGYPGGTPMKQPKGLALSAMIVGIVSLVFCAVPILGIGGGIVAVVLGIIALKKAQSKGMSLTGMITGGIAVLVAIILLIVTLAFVGAVTTSGTTALDELEQLSEELESVSPDTSQEPVPETDAAEPVWTTVATINGNADHQSDTITLTGGKVRVTYDFVDTSGYGTIVGAIYVLDEGVDIMQEGGIPDVMVSEAGAGETILRKSAGEYYVKVTSANASYTVTVEEEK